MGCCKLLILLYAFLLTLLLLVLTIYIYSKKMGFVPAFGFERFPFLLFSMLERRLQKSVPTFFFLISPASSKNVGTLERNRGIVSTWFLITKVSPIAPNRINGLQPFQKTVSLKSTNFRSIR